MKQMNKSKEEINEILVSYLLEESSEEESTFVRNLIKSDEEVKRQYLALKSSWMLSAQGSNPHQFDARKAYEAFTVRHNRSGNLCFRGFLRYAAVFVFAFFMGLGIHWMISGPEEQMASIIMNETEVPYGVRSKVYLADGTLVWLNAGSKLTYPSVFQGEERRVQLEGEAYFEVKTNPQIPFVVDVSGIMVKAYGTKFNIKAYGDEPAIETLLVEGKVTVSRNSKPEEVIHLVPNEMVAIERQSGTIVQPSGIQPEELESIPLKETSRMTSTEETESVISWKDSQWIIHREQLGSLAKKLERLYNIEIGFEDLTLREFRYSGTLLDEPLDQLLEVIGLTSPLKYSIDGNRVTFSRNKEFESKYQNYYYKK